MNLFGLHDDPAERVHRYSQDNVIGMKSRDIWICDEKITMETILPSVLNTISVSILSHPKSLDKRRSECLTSEPNTNETMIRMYLRCPVQATRGQRRRISNFLNKSPSSLTLRSTKVGNWSGGLPESGI